MPPMTITIGDLELNTAIDRLGRPGLPSPLASAAATSFVYRWAPVAAMMAMAGSITIAEVEHLVEPGEIDPDQVHTPGIFVHRIFQGANYEKRIEQRTVSKG